MSFDIETVALISLYAQSVLYGVFAVIFAQSCYYNFEQNRKNVGLQVVNARILMVSLIMFILASVHISAAFWTLLDAFVWAPRAMTVKKLDSLRTKAYLVQQGAYQAQTLVADGFMLYRLYMVWGKNGIICVPAVVTILGCVGTTIGSLHENATSVGTRVAPYSRGKQAWDIAFAVLTLFTNGYATALIAARIWNFQSSQNTERKALSIQFKESLGQTAAIVIESGAIYSASMVVLVVLYGARSNSIIIIFDCLPQIIGIVFSLIIVRVAVGISHTGRFENETEEQVTCVSTLVFQQNSHDHGSLELGFE